MSFEELEEELPARTDLGGLSPLLACRLLTAVQPGYRWCQPLGLLAEADKPVSQVRGIRGSARHIVRMNGYSVAVADLLGAPRASRYYRDGSPEARDAFFLACIRTDAGAIV